MRMVAVLVVVCCLVQALGCLVSVESEQPLFSDEELLEYASSWYVEESVSSPVPQGPVDWLPEALIPYDGILDASWPMQSHDVVHTGRSNLSTENVTGTEIWRIWEGRTGTIFGAPLIDSEGIIYFGTHGSDHSLHAFYPNGTKKWRYQSDGAIWATPAIAEDGTIIFPTWGGDSTVHAVNPDGTVKWTYLPNDYAPSISSPAIGNDGTIYFGTEGYPDYYIYALNSDGTFRWKYSTGYYITGAPAIGTDGTIYIGSGDRYIYAMNPDGTLRWRFKTGDYIKGGVTIAPDGTIYVPSFDEYFYALTPDGELLWKGFSGDSVAAAGLALAEDGTIYIGTERLRAYNPDGTLKWTADLPGDVFGTVPAVSADGTIYVSAGGSLVAVNPDGTMRWSKEIVDQQIRSSPSIGPNDRVYVGSNDYSNQWRFHAFGLGPLRAEAQGPYQGTALKPTQFKGIAFGGTLPYSYLWDFGDGTTSSELAPTYIYQDGGNYTATFTLTDATGNQSIDTANVTMDYPYHLVTIIRPENRLYLGNFGLFETSRPFIIGPITVEINISRVHYAIDRVTFRAFEEEFIDEEPPYTWTWRNPNFFRFWDFIYVGVKDVKGRWTEVRIDVIKWL